MFIETNRLVDTLLTFFEYQKPVMDTLIKAYLGERYFLNTFKGLRGVIPFSSLPSLEIGFGTDTAEWRFVRVQKETMSLQIHLSFADSNDPTSLDLEGKLVSIIAQTLAFPPHLRPQIQGTSHWLLDSKLPQVTYGNSATADSGDEMRVTQISWSGESLNFLSDNMFPAYLQGGGFFPKI